MAVAVGDIVEGVVSNLTKFGAFINLDDGESGLCHISEVSDKYVEKISDFLEVGKEVKVKVISNQNGKIALSIRQALPKREVPKAPRIVNTDNLDSNFEDKLSKFLKESNEKLEQARSRQKQKNKSSRARNRF